MQLRRQAGKGLQQLCRRLAGREQPPGLQGQAGIQTPPGRHQHGTAGSRVPQRVSRVQQGRQFHDFSPDADPNRHQLPPHPAAGGGPEHHLQHDVGGSGGNDQYLYIHIGIKDAAHHRHGTAGDQPQCQHAPGHGAGNRQQQKRQPQQFLLPAEGDEGHHHAESQLHRRLGQEGAPRQKHRHGVSAANKSCQEIPQPFQRHPCKTGCGEQQQIIHQCVERKHAVHINDGHGAPPLPGTLPGSPCPTDLIIGQPLRKTGRKNAGKPSFATGGCANGRRGV